MSILLAIGAFLLAPSWTAGLLRVGVAVAVAVFVGWFAVGAIADAVAQAARTPEGQTAVTKATSFGSMVGSAGWGTRCPSSNAFV